MAEGVRDRWISIGGNPRHAGYLALPPSGSGPGILLYQEIVGVNSYVRAVARQWAQDGFVVLAPDVFWRAGERIELGYEGSDRSRGMALKERLEPRDFETDATAAFDTLRNLPEVVGARVGTLGFCMGGLLAFIACATTNADACVAYYGGGIEQRLDLVSGAGAPLMFHYGEKDEHIPPDAAMKVRDATRARGQVFLYPDAPHGFDNWERPSRHHAPSAALARGRSLVFFAQQLFRPH